MATAFGRARDEPDVAGEGHHRERSNERSREHLHALAVHDLALVGRSARRHCPHLGDRERVPKGIAQLDPVHQMMLSTSELTLNSPIIDDMPSISGFSWL